MEIFINDYHYNYYKKNKKKYFYGFQLTILQLRIFTF